MALDTIAKDTIVQNNGMSFAKLDYQEGGAGNPWVTIAFLAGVDPIAGGDWTFTRNWANRNDGRPVYRSATRSASPSAVTTTLTMGMLPEFTNLLAKWSKMTEAPCGNEVITFRVRGGCQLNDRQSYEWMQILPFSFALSRGGWTAAVIDLAGSALNRRTVSIEAALMQELWKAFHQSNTSQSIAKPLNALLKTGYQTLFTVSDLSTNSSIGYSNDAGVNWEWSVINTLATAGFHATDIEEFNRYLVVASPAAGITYAARQDVVDGVTTPWAMATLNGVAWATTFPNGVIAVNNSKLLCYGDNGFVAESMDGISWTTVPSGSTEDLTVSATIDNNSVVIGGTTGELLRYSNGVLSAIATGLTDDITTLCVPDTRSNELHIGTDGTEIWRTRNIKGTTPIFTQMPIGQSAGVISFIRSVEYGTILIYGVTATGETTIYRDLSGGNYGADVETLVTPSNSGINDLVAIYEFQYVCVGEIEGTNGYIGLIGNSQEVDG